MSEALQRWGGAAGTCVEGRVSSLSSGQLSNQLCGFPPLPECLEPGSRAEEVEKGLRQLGAANSGSYVRNLE